MPFKMYCLPVAKRFRAKGCQENEKTVSMAPLGFLNEDVKTAGSTKDIIAYYNPDLFSINKMMNVKTIENYV